MLPDNDFISRERGKTFEIKEVDFGLCEREIHFLAIYLRVIFGFLSLLAKSGPKYIVIHSRVYVVFLRD